MVLFFCIAGCQPAVVDREPLLREVVLLDEYETIFRATGELVSGAGGYQQLSKASAEALRVPFARLLSAFDALAKASSKTLLQKAEVVYVGARDFRAPSGLGAVQSHYCYLITLIGGSRANLQDLFNESPREIEPGARAWQWSAPPDEGHPKPYMFYATDVSDKFILVSDTVAQLERVAQRLRSLENNPRDASQLPGFANVPRHEYWGYRRYRPTDPAHQIPAGMNDVTPSARALTFVVDPEQKAGALRLYASDASTAEKVNATTAATNSALPLLGPSDPGVWQANISLVEDQRFLDRIVAVMGLFGFGLYL